MYVCLSNIYASKVFPIGEECQESPVGEVWCHHSCLLILQLGRLSLLPRSWTEYSLHLLYPSKVQPGANEHHNEVEDAKSPKDPIVQPLVAVVYIETRCELIPRGVLTEFAKAVAAILHIAAGLGDEGCRIRLACLAWWRRESSEFGGGADDGATVGGD